MKKLSSNLSKIIVSTIAVFLLFVGAASAHVTVKPNVSTVDAWETYSIKVPVEKDVATTKVALKIPTGVEFKQYQPVPGWEVATGKDSSGNVTTITWTATDAGISAGEFQQFNFVAKNPANEIKVSWDAYQYYKDGSIVEWTGEEGSKTPHSVTTISKSTADDTSVQDEHAVKDDNTKTAATEETSSTGLQTATLIISILALVLAITALLKRKK